RPRWNCNGTAPPLPSPREEHQRSAVEPARLGKVLVLVDVGLRLTTVPDPWRHARRRMLDGLLLELLVVLEPELAPGRVGCLGRRNGGARRLASTLRVLLSPILKFLI